MHVLVSLKHACSNFSLLYLKHVGIISNSKSPSKDVH